MVRVCPCSSSLEELQKQAEGWAVDPEGWIVVKQRDRLEGGRVVVERKSLP
jgi:hypothetical protein